MTRAKAHLSQPALEESVSSEEIDDLIDQWHAMPNPPCELNGLACPGKTIRNVLGMIRCLPPRLTVWVREIPCRYCAHIVQYDRYNQTEEIECPNCHGTVYDRFARTVELPQEEWKK